VGSGQCPVSQPQLIGLIIGFVDVSSHAMRCSRVRRIAPPTDTLGLPPQLDNTYKINMTPSRLRSRSVSLYSSSNSRERRSERWVG
jgi:hypothetical protein